MEAGDLCTLVAELKLKRAEPFLRDALTNDCDDIQRPACGALAALGDPDALSRLRQFARKGHALGRSDAIRWLGLVGDRPSADFFKQATTDEEPSVREAAQEAFRKVATQPTGTNP